MTNEIHVNEILATYTDKEQEVIIFEMRLMSFLGLGGAPQTDEEFKKFCDKTLAEKKAEKEKEEKAKQRKIDNEKRRAEENGMTVEEYRAYKKLQAKKKRYEREIAKFEEEIEKLQKAIAWKKKFLEEN
jgi:hypothetical protein